MRAKRDFTEEEVHTDTMPKTPNDGTDLRAIVAPILVAVAVLGVGGEGAGPLPVTQAATAVHLNIEMSAAFYDST